MHIAAWPESAQREWYTYLIQTLQLGLNARGPTYMGAQEVRRVVDMLMERIPTSFDWPTRYEHDKEICRLRFVDNISGIDLHARVKKDGLNTEHQRITEIDRAWTATFQTAINDMLKQRGHPLRRPMYLALHAVRPALAAKFKVKGTCRT